MQIKKKHFVALKMAQRWSRYISNIETFHNKYIEVFLWISSNTSCQTRHSGTHSESSRQPEWIVGTDQLIVIFNSMASCWMCSTMADPFFSDQKNELKIPHWQVATAGHPGTRTCDSQSAGGGFGSPDRRTHGEMTTSHTLKRLSENCSINEIIEQPLSTSDDCEELNESEIQKCSRPGFGFMNSYI